jgi:glutaredoxin
MSEYAMSEHVMSEPRIALYTRSNCHLCDDAKAALNEITATTGEPWQEISVDGDIELEREYGDRLPVIMLDGKEHGYFRVETDRLLRDLNKSK